MKTEIHFVVFGRMIRNGKDNIHSMMEVSFKGLLGTTLSFMEEWFTKAAILTTESLNMDREMGEVNMSQEDM